MKKFLNKLPIFIFFLRKDVTNASILDAPFFYVVTRAIFIFKSFVIKLIITHFFKKNFMILSLVALSILNVSSYFTIKMLYNLNIERKDRFKVIIITILPIVLSIFLVKLDLPWHINILFSTFIEEVFFTNLILIKLNIEDYIFWINNNNYNNMNNGAGGGNPGGPNPGGPNPGGPYNIMDINSILNPVDKDKSNSTQTDDTYISTSQSSVSANTTNTVAAPPVASSSQVQSSVGNSAASYFYSMEDLRYLISREIYANMPAHFWYGKDIPAPLLSESFLVGKPVHRDDVSSKTWQLLLAARGGPYEAKTSMSFSRGLKERLEWRYGTVKTRY